VNAIDALLRPRDPDSGWYWSPDARNPFGTLSAADRVRTEELAIASGGKPPLNLLRVAMLVVAVGGVLWGVASGLGVRTRRNPRRRRRNPARRRRRNPMTMVFYRLRKGNKWGVGNVLPETYDYGSPNLTRSPGGLNVQWFDTPDEAEQYMFDIRRFFSKQDSGTRVVFKRIAE
jgi:hypothetical protein